MEEYLKAQSKTNEIIVGNAVNSDELDRFSKSDFRWADNRKKAFQFKILSVLYSSFHHFTNNGPQIIRKLLLILGCKFCIAAADYLQFCRYATHL